MLSEIILRDIEERCGHLDQDFLRNKKVLVTGASGLIGTYILAYLVSLVRTGFSIDIYAQSFSELPNHMNALMQKGNIRHLQVDLADASQYYLLPDADIIIHSAGYAQPILFMSNPVATLQINVSATIALLQRLRPNGTFVFMSSAEVYCGLVDSKFREDFIGTSTPYHQRASYIEGKRCGESVCSAFRSQGARAIAIRLGDVYGPGTRMRDKRALNSFIEKGLLNKKIDLLDSGSAMRTYCYVADALEMILNILFSGKQPVYNVGGRSCASIAELALLIGKLTDAEVIFPDKETAVAGSPSVLRLDLGRVDAEFAKTEYLGLNEGLVRTIGWQRELYSCDSGR
jgi:nucleoside-diphosphate-sugar epimerase